MAKGKKKGQIDQATAAFQQGWRLTTHSGMFAPIMVRATVNRKSNNLCPAGGWAIVESNGTIHVHPTRRGEPEEWQYVLSHCLLHLAFEHFREQANDELFYLWNIACDVYVTRFLTRLKIGKQPPEIVGDAPSLPSGDENVLFRQLMTRKVPDLWLDCGTTSRKGADMMMSPPNKFTKYRSPHFKPPDWPNLFAQGVSLAVTYAVADTSNVKLNADGKRIDLTRAERARQWFISKYPLLGALATGFTLIEDQRICQRMGISVAAVNPQMQEIYINPAFGMSQDELRFVMAHEILHAALRHDVRCQGRDPFLWNVACDYVINDWLIQMDVGAMPSFGALWDESLRGMSAESIYEQIIKDIRHYRKQWTLHGKGMGDILIGKSEWWRSGAGMTLDEFYRRALAEGLEYHQHQGRGYLPAGLVEEIRALTQPVIPWDVRLAKWFDTHFPPIEKRRTYARPSRRQASTPHIPRPSYVKYEQHDKARTFGVVLDTSGSMDRSLLAKALGTIASYSLSRDVVAVRVVFCDATYYDAGYMPPEDIADRVKVKGRGGTVLQPAIDFLENTPDFPKDGPLLIITDGQCDRLTVRGGRPHAYLLPHGRSLPFAPKGEMFHISKK